MTRGLIAFSGCVWATGREFGSLNFPLEQDRKDESLLMFFFFFPQKVEQEKKTEEYVLKVIRSQISKMESDSITDAHVTSPLPHFVLFSDTS